MNAKHNPLPWRQNRKVKTTIESAAHPQGMVLICDPADEIDRDTALADAELICRAVNAHEPLVAALTDAYNALAAFTARAEADWQPGERWRHMNTAQVRAFAALKLAKGE